jgi:hypothetical protein
VAADSNRIWRLAGFAASELTEFYNAIRMASSRARSDRVHFLISLAEPNGDRIEYPVARGGTASVWNAWAARRPQNWPNDTSLVAQPGSTLVRQTILSQQLNSYDQGWVPVVYTFYFADDGELRAWARREGLILRP